jgi:hypothetical protein
VTTQPTALRLANALEAWTLGKPTYHRKAAVELRRLHALNAELLEALKMAMLDWENMRVVPPASRPHKAARAAIAKAEGQA